MPERQVFHSGHRSRVAGQGVGVESRTLFSLGRSMPSAELRDLCELENF